MRSFDTCVYHPFEYATALRIQQPSAAPRGRVKHIPLCNMGKMEYLYRDTIFVDKCAQCCKCKQTFYKAKARLRTTIHMETFLHHINFLNLEIKCNKPIKRVNNEC